MKDELKSLFLAAVGSAAYTYEKASNLIDELIKKGQLTVDQGKELTEELKKTIKDKTKESSNKEEKPITKEEMAQLLKEMNFATKDEISDIKTRLCELEKKINK